jgi:hypothetical protein
VAISNSSAAPATVKLELYTLDGQPTGMSSSKVIPAMGQIALFLDQIPEFENLQESFKGFLRISGPTVAVTGLRARYNERRDFLFAATPPIAETTSHSSAELIFPHFVDGGGYATQFIVSGGASGESSRSTLSFMDQSGQAMPLSLY